VRNESTDSSGGIGPCAREVQLGAITGRQNDRLRHARQTGQRLRQGIASLGVEVHLLEYCQWGALMADNNHS
jgi:hypothetical protein